MLLKESLYSYLLQFRQLPIPGLGTILVERKPAQTDFVNKQLLPPSFSFKFDKYFDAPDKEFFTFLAAQNDMADYEAIRWYNEWSYELRNKIRTDNPVVLEKVGMLKKDLSGDIVFVPAPPLDLALEPVAAERVIRQNAKHTVLVGDREWTNEEAAENLSGDESKESKAWWIITIVLTTILLLILFFKFYQNGLNTGAIGNQQTIGF